MPDSSTTEPERQFMLTESALILLMNQSYQYGWSDSRRWPNAQKPFQLQPVLEVNDGEVTNFRAVRR